jgi:methyl-accepting chemotaxis protein-2 (aspartate sensor receptor)
MAHQKYHPSSWNVGTRISATTFLLMGAIIAILIATITMATSSMLHERATQTVATELRGVANTVEMFNKAVSSSAKSFGGIFRNTMSGNFELDTTAIVDIGGKATPSLKLDGKVLNLDFSAPDSFTKQTTASATIFAVNGDDFVRVTTSVKKENGERAVGTNLDRSSPPYAVLRAGGTYIGLVTLFGKQYITQYEPVKDASGKVVAVLYVGVNITEDLKMLKDRIRATKVGETGYFYVLNAAPGKQYGDLIVHPTAEGSNLLGAKDADGREFIKDILEKKQGTATYAWKDPGETQARDRFVAYTHNKDWNWIIAGGTYEDEITAAAKELRNKFIGLGLLALAVFAATLYLVVRASVSRPLAEVREVAKRIAEGDLTARMANSRRDEIGLLTDSINTIGTSLMKVVGQVRAGTDTISTASAEIAAGNLDLSSRTEQQASSLEETASSMEELTSTVKENADNAREANTLAAKSSTVAAKGGTVIHEVVVTMAQINESAKKIVDIITVIDGIAFQTNILALNAAVEAARAGEQGRGFAVVATEVRTLAQRSANAAKEIKLLIADSVDKVESGSKLVSDAGSTMNEIVHSVRSVTTIMEQISAASQEQTAGIEQINQAIVEMDQVTQQNAALVEEAAAASQAMQEQAAQLADVVSVFKLDNVQHLTAGVSVRSTVATPVKPRSEAVRAALPNPGKALRKARPASGDIKAPRKAVSTGGDDWEEF